MKRTTKLLSVKGTSIILRGSLFFSLSFFNSHWALTINVEKLTRNSVYEKKTKISSGLRHRLLNSFHDTFFFLIWVLTGVIDTDWLTCPIRVKPGACVRVCGSKRTCRSPCMCVYLLNSQLMPKSLSVHLSLITCVSIHRVHHQIGMSMLQALPSSATPLTSPPTIPLTQVLFLMVLL